MKRIIVMLALMAVLLVPAAALAYNPGVALPSGATEVEAFEWNGTVWSSIWVNGAGAPAANARCWSSTPDSGACNKQNWVINITNHASVAQWIDWSIGGTRWDWRIRKPGTYAADCINFTIKSNNDVAVNFDGFADLEYLEQGAGVKQTIDTYYSYGGSIEAAQSNGWIRAADLNNADFIFPDGSALHSGLNYKLWNKIVVENCNSSCEYEDTATITLTVRNMKHWIDPETGNFKSDQT